MRLALYESFREVERLGRVHFGRHRRLVGVDHDFDKQHYDFHYVRREFLGEVRCLVFDVTPKKGSGNGRFLGRIWVEDQDFNIVRIG